MPPEAAPPTRRADDGDRAAAATERALDASPAAFVELSAKAQQILARQRGSPSGPAPEARPPPERTDTKQTSKELEGDYDGELTDVTRPEESDRDVRPRYPVGKALERYQVLAGAPSRAMDHGSPLRILPRSD